jgi:hypothetical protein
LKKFTSLAILPIVGALFLTGCEDYCDVYKWEVFMKDGTTIYAIAGDVDIEDGVAKFEHGGEENYKVLAKGTWNSYKIVGCEEY